MTTALKSRNIIYKWPDKINNLIFIPKLYIFLINVSHTILYLPIKKCKISYIIINNFYHLFIRNLSKLTFKVLTDPQGHQAFIGSTKTPIPIDPTCGEHDSLSLHLSLSPSPSTTSSHVRNSRRSHPINLIILWHPFPTALQHFCRRSPGEHRPSPIDTNRVTSALWNSCLAC